MQILQKESVRIFWDKTFCGERLHIGGNSREDYERQAEIRYELEPFIPDFAEFEKYRVKRVLEVGVGLGGYSKFPEYG